MIISKEEKNQEIFVNFYGNIIWRVKNNSTDRILKIFNIKHKYKI
jgi:hypothetical protein